MNTNDPQMRTFKERERSVRARLKDMDGVIVWHTSHNPEDVDKELEIKLYIDEKLFLHTDIPTLLLLYFSQLGRFPSDKSKVKLFIGGKEVPFRLVEKEER